MSTDPLEDAVAEAVHEAFMQTQPTFVSTLRWLITNGQPRVRILRWLKAGNPSDALYLEMEMEVDYLLEQYGEQ